jgi:uncharacterized protein YlxW (UPF0749 family)
MKDKEESISGDDETQVSLILLQFASTQEVVGMVGVQGPGVTLSISPMPSEKQLQNLPRAHHANSSLATSLKNLPHTHHANSSLATSLLDLWAFQGTHGAPKMASKVV